MIFILRVESENNKLKRSQNAFYTLTAAANWANAQCTKYKVNSCLASHSIWSSKNILNLGQIEILLTRGFNAPYPVLGGHLAVGFFTP